MCLLERNTFKRGRSAVPVILRRTRACLFLRATFLVRLSNHSRHSFRLPNGYYLPVLPSLRRTYSPS